MTKFATRRLIASATVFVYACTSFFWDLPKTYAAEPSPVTNLFDPANLKIPSELGKLDELTPPSGKKPYIVYLQDAHAIYGAQKGIQGLIDFFQKAYRAPLVAAEGAVGPLDPVLFRTFPLEEVKLSVFDSLIKKGEVSGLDAAAILNSG